MKTTVTSSAEEAASFIARGGVVAFPTETVYGLGANIFDVDAVKRIFAAKGRPADNPLIAHISSRVQVRRLTPRLAPFAIRLLEEFTPGPLTIVVERSPEVPDIATAGLNSIGIRIPGLPIAHEFLTACKVPVAAPSANLSGRPSPTTWEAVAEDLDGRIDCILQGLRSEVGIESTVVDCTSPVPIILRPGTITLEQIRLVTPDAVMFDPEDISEPKSPGLKHRHYSPNARVEIYGGNEVSGTHNAYIGLNRPRGDFRVQAICEDLGAYASALYEFFRECDRSSIEVIYCEAVSANGIGTALMDRIRRASNG